MADPFLGEIKMVGFNYPPRYYAACNGQLLSISQNALLFALLGTTYGGNGTTFFALPDFRGRVPMHWGYGNGLTPRNLGDVGGSETVPLAARPLGDADGTEEALDGEAPAPSNMMPYCTLNFVIALQGMWPCRP